MFFLQWSFHIRNVGVEGLETLTYSQAQLEDQITSLKKRYHCSEVFYLSTCNRVEFLLASNMPFKNSEPDFTQLKPDIKTDLESITTYWLEVCCSLDSVVFGENQIIGQVKRSFLDLLHKKLVGSAISKFMNFIFRESKWIRNHSNLSRIQTSVSSVAVKKLISQLPKGGKVLLVGFGETNQLVYKSLKKKQKYEILVCNRTLQNVEEQVDSSTQILSWEDFQKNKMKNVDAVILAVANQKHILNEEKLTSLKPSYVFDLSVPANAEASLVQNFCSYIGLEEIKNIAELNKKDSENTIKEVKVLIQLSVEKIMGDLAKRSLDEIISVNIEKSLQIQKELILNDQTLQMFSSEQINLLKELSEKLVKKINHVHLTSMKEVYSQLSKPSGS